MDTIAEWRKRAAKPPSEYCVKCDSTPCVCNLSAEPRDDVPPLADGVTIVPTNRRTLTLPRGQTLMAELNNRTQQHLREMAAMLPDSEFQRMYMFNPQLPWSCPHCTELCPHYHYDGGTFLVKVIPSKGPNPTQRDVAKAIREAETKARTQGVSAPPSSSSGYASRYDDIDWKLFNR